MVSDRISFLESLKNIVLENISDERFGVSELADKAGMSRSNLLRRIRKEADLSASQYVRNIRLEYAMEILKDGSSTVSELAFMSGFNSVSYFVKCFHDHYGYPPGEVGSRSENNKLASDEIVKEDGEMMGRGERESPSTSSGTGREGEPFDKLRDLEDGRVGENGNRKLGFAIVALLLTVVILIIVFKPFAKESGSLESSIAVLPFKNDSNDTSNIYFINGLMEAVLNNLQSIEDLRVVSRTSVEKYRYAPMIIPEIAKELDVSYFVEGSGQKSGDEILLNIKLVEAETGRQIWSKQFRRKLEDVFEMQGEIASSIASSIRVSITPEEVERISKAPTENLLAYDIFLKGLDLLNNPIPGNLEEALAYFLEALEEDNEFARAYAAVAITYYMMDKNLASKNYTDLINTYADKALLYDDQLAQSLIAKGLYYMSTEEYPLAVSYFEKALEYNPNSDLVYVFLVDLYANYYPNTEKYLEYALKGLQVNMAPYDSMTKSFSYLHISNAFIQSGFVDEAEEYINLSLDYFPENIYSAYVKPYILYSKTKDLEETKQMLISVLEKDTNRLDVLQELAKVLFYQEDYQDSYKYYRKYVEAKKIYKLDIYPGEDAKIALVYSEVGQQAESDSLISTYRLYAENDNSVYKHLSLCAYYSFINEADKAIEHLEIFSNEDNYHYWIVLFLDIDPLLNNIRERDEYDAIIKKINNRFDIYHNRIRSTLEKEELI